MRANEVIDAYVADVRLQRAAALGAQRVIAPRRAGVDAPFAAEQALAFEPAQQRVQRAFLDHHAALAERLPQFVAVAGRTQLRQHREHQHAAAEFEFEFFDGVGRCHVAHGTVRHTVCQHPRRFGPCYSPSAAYRNSE